MMNQLRKFLICIYDIDLYTRPLLFQESYWACISIYVKDIWLTVIGRNGLYHELDSSENLFEMFIS